MSIGSAMNIEQLNKVFKFPGRFKFSLCRENTTRKNSIVVTSVAKVLEKKKLENIKFLETKSLGFDCRFVALDIIDCASAEVMVKYIEEFNDFWVKESEGATENERKN